MDSNSKEDVKFEVSLNIFRCLGAYRSHTSTSYILGIVALPAF